MSFVFWDTETTGISTDFDQILQFAAIHTDDKLEELDRIEIRCRLHPHVVPHPGALRVTRMTVEQLTDSALPCHYTMVREIRAKLIEWSPATFVGYNSLRFDEQLLRQALFRTLHSPYLTNTGGNCRMDALTLVQAASVFVPGCVQIPTGDKGQAVYKLDRLAPLNGFDHSNAHDALADVEATIHIARCVRANAPQVWHRFLRFSGKAAVAAFVREEDAFVATEFYFNKPYHFVVTAFGADPGNPAAVLALDLNVDIDWLTTLPDDQLAVWVARSPKPVRRIKTNAAPTLAPIDEVPEAVLGPLDRETIARRAARLRGDEVLKSRLIAAVAASAPEYEDSPHVEEQLYTAFASNADQARMERFHQVDWPERIAIVEQLEDARLRYHGRRLIHELHPELLAQEHRREVEAHMRERLLIDPAPKGKWTTLPAALAATEKMLLDCQEADLALLTAFRAHLLGRLENGLTEPA